jgi:uncharacterized protein (TIGR00297 family)
MGLEYFLGLLVISLVVLAEFLRRKKLVNPVDARKILHIGAIGVSAASIYLVEEVRTLLIIALSAIPVLLAAVLLGFFKNPENGRKSYGIVYFASIFAVLLLLLGEERSEIIYYGFLVLAFADGFATVAGHRFARTAWPFSPDGKSPLGSAVFFAVAFTVLTVAHFFFPSVPIPSLPLLFALFLALFLAVIEALSLRGLDNLWIPGFIAYWLLLEPDFSDMRNLISTVLIPGLAFFAYHRKWLTSGGAFAAAILGWILLINPEPELIVPALCFFVVGSLLSRLPGHADESDRRNADQVFANGGIPVVWLMGYHLVGDEAFSVASISGFAFALSDTASSEIGVRYGKKHFSIRNFEKVESGLSGAVSLQGTLAGLVFAGSMAIPAAFFVSEKGIWIVVAAGFFGNLLDTVVGAFLQRKYRKSDGQWSDRRDKKSAKPHRGLVWVNNNTTNLISTLGASLLGYLLYQWL